MWLWLRYAPSTKPTLVMFGTTRLLSGLSRRLISGDERGRAMDDQDVAVTFTDGTDRVKALLADSKHTAAIKEIRQEMDEADREHAMTLAMIRNAAEFTQEELAGAMGIRQSNVSTIENRSDLLLSTFAKYVHSLGAELEIRVRLSNGRMCEFDVDEVLGRP